MYEDDASPSGRASLLSGELLKEVLFSTSLRPRIPRGLVKDLEARLQRTVPGYAPRSPDDLLDWAKERFLMPFPEWEALLAAVERDHGLTAAEAAAPIRDKILSVRLPGASGRVVVSLEHLDRLARAFSVAPDALDARVVWTDVPLREEALRAGLAGGAGHDSARGEQDDTALSDILLQWLSFYGPVGKSFPAEVLGLGPALLDDALAGLIEQEALILDLLTERAEEPEVCDRENLEILLRMARKARQPSFRALPVDHLPLFLASWQGLVAPGEALDDLKESLDRLFGFPAVAEAWEKHILPARMSPYYGSWLDSLTQTSGLTWFGCGGKRLAFAFPDDLELFLEKRGRPDGGAAENESLPDGLSRLFPRRFGRYSLPDIVRFSRSDSRAATRKLWDLVWQGLVANDTFASVRQGIMTDFAPTGPRIERHAPFRAGRNRWGAVQPFPGNWHVLDVEGLEKDSIDEAELVKDRVRQLFRRYGILFREIVSYELPLLQWAAIFKALRLMELLRRDHLGPFLRGRFRPPVHVPRSVQVPE